jgi:hypothetical protein
MIPARTATGGAIGQGADERKRNPPVFGHCE